MVFFGLKQKKGKTANPLTQRVNYFPVSFNFQFIIIFYYLSGAQGDAAVAGGVAWAADTGGRVDGPVEAMRADIACAACVGRQAGALAGHRIALRHVARRACGKRQKEKKKMMTVDF